MSGSSSSNVTVLPEAEAENWAGELESLAGIHTKSDAPRALEARKLAEEIRVCAQKVKDARQSADARASGLLLEKLGALRMRAIRVLHPG